MTRPEEVRASRRDLATTNSSRDNNNNQPSTGNSRDSSNNNNLPSNSQLSNNNPRDNNSHSSLHHFRLSRLLFPTELLFLREPVRPETEFRFPREQFLLLSEPLLHGPGSLHHQDQPPRHPQGVDSPISPPEAAPPPQPPLQPRELVPGRRHRLLSPRHRPRWLRCPRGQDSLSVSRSPDPGPQPSPVSLSSPISPPSRSRTSSQPSSVPGPPPLPPPDPP